MDTASSRERPGGKAKMESAGIEHGVSNTMVLDGFTSMGRAAVGNTGIHMYSKILGMRGSLTMVSITAMKTQSNSEKSGSHLRCRNLNPFFLNPFPAIYT